MTLKIANDKETAVALITAVFHYTQEDNLRQARLSWVYILGCVLCLMKISPGLRAESTLVKKFIF
jgi:hypothetical protein